MPALSMIDSRVSASGLPSGTWTKQARSWDWAHRPAPAGLRPPGVGDRPVDVAGSQVVPEAGGADVPERVVLPVLDDLRDRDGAAGEVEEQRVVAVGRVCRGLAVAGLLAGSAEVDPAIRGTVDAPAGGQL